MQVELKQEEPLKEIVYPMLMEFQDDDGYMIAMIVDYNQGVILYNNNRNTSIPCGKIVTTADLSLWKPYHGSITLRNE